MITMFSLTFTPLSILRSIVKMNNVSKSTEYAVLSRYINLGT